MTATPRQKLTGMERFAELVRNDPQISAMLPDETVDLGENTSYLDRIENVLRAYASRPAIGTRRYELRSDPATGRTQRAFLPEFETTTYAELRRRITQIASVWTSHPEFGVACDELVCMIGHTGLDFATLDLACAYAQTLSVPLQVSAAGGEMEAIFAHIAPAALAVTVADAKLGAELAGRHRSIRSLIVFDYEPGDDDDRERFMEAKAELAANGSSAQIITIADLIALGEGKEWQPLPPHPDGLRRMAVILHSSGSTGIPKGVIVTDFMARALFRQGPNPVLTVSAMPMNHFGGRGGIYPVLAVGGTSCMTTKADLSLYFEDVRLVRPTQVSALPRMLEGVRNHYLDEVARRLAAGGEEALIRAEVMSEMRDSFFGDRISFLSHGTAPLNETTRAFLVECFQAHMAEGYGQTEAGGNISTNGRITRPLISDYKLRDVPALGYFTTDKPFPRGELLVKTPNATPGYYKQPELTAKIFDEDGFICTGDIVEERGPDQVAVIDRANDVLKLSHGEFVAVGALGITFESGSEAIQQIYVYGNSRRNHLLAVIVPNMGVADARLGEGHGEATLADYLRSELSRVAREQGLRGSEVPRDFLIEHQPFTVENGLLTTSLKRKRPALKAHYGERLEALYEAIAAKGHADLQALRDASDVSIEEKVSKALGALLGIEGIDPESPNGFVGLGGDSLSAVDFSALLDEIFGVELPVNTILNPASTIRHWARAIEAAQGGGPSGSRTLADIHGKDPQMLRAKDCDIRHFIEIDHPLPEKVGKAQCVLLTGATGFLGRFLCLEWLERVAERGGKVICLIRAGDSNTALKRLIETYGSTDPALNARFAELSAKHLEVLASDIAEPRLGLDDATYDRLCNEVDHVVHCGALVNHMLPYAQLFAPNVVGTAELVRLALTGHRKRFDFISTVGVFGFLEEGAITEETPLRTSINMATSYAWGYGASKWASEHIIASAHEHFGLNVSIFRCDMILSHRKYLGQINLSDNFTRQLLSFVLTQSVPNSYYELSADGQRQKAHYDGLPVDFIAGAIVGIGDNERQAHPQVYHVSNPHADKGVSMDSFLDWLAELRPVARLEDHARWFELYEAKLQALPAETRQQTAWPMINRFREPFKVASQHPDNSAFAAAVAKCGMGGIPALDQAFIRKCLDDLEAHGLIEQAAMESVNA